MACTTINNLFFLVMFPRLMTYFTDRVFVGEGLKFFISVLEDLIEQRNNSSEVDNCNYN